MSGLIKEIQTLRDELFNRIAIATSAKRAMEIELHNQRLQRVERLNSQFDAMAKQVDALKAEIQSPRRQLPSPYSGQLRRFEIRLTAGMINNHMLVVTPFEGQIAYGEEMYVLTEQSRFLTKFMKVGHRLQARGAVSWFYRLRKVKPGVMLVLEEITPGTWFLETRKESITWGEKTFIKRGEQDKYPTSFKRIPKHDPEMLLHPIADAPSQTST